MTLQRVTDSIIAADIGTAWTHVLLVDRVAGTYRFVAKGEAPSTIAAPHHDLTVGLRNAIRQLEKATKRRFLDDEGQVVFPEGPDGQGVDFLVATSSAAPAITVAVGGLMSRVSVASAVRAIQSTYSTVTHTFALDAPEGRWGSADGITGVVARLLPGLPDAFVLTGGLEGGLDDTLLELVEALALSIGAAQQEAAPTVIFAGNSTLQEAVQARMGTEALVGVAENLRPTIQTERLRQTGRLLDQRYRHTRLRELPGHDALRDWGVPGVVPGVEAFAHVIEYLALSRNKRVLGVELGASHATLAATFEDRVTQVTVRRDLGLATFARSLSPETLLEWVTIEKPTDVLYNDLLNVALLPAQLPMTDETIALLQGVARRVLRQLVLEASEVWEGRHENVLPPFDIIVGSGRLFREVPRPVQALAILLDAVQPLGVCAIYRDRTGIIPAIGALAEHEPPVAAAMMKSDPLERLGTVITPWGRARMGEEIVRFRLSQASGVTEGTVEYGQSYCFPTVQPAEIELRPTRHINIGFGAGVGATLVGEGDSVGFVIDGRGRPLELPEEANDRRDRVKEWNRYVGA